MMFKEKSINKLYAFALAAVFALTLAGCGGGGGTAEVVEPDPPVVVKPTPEEMCAADGGRYEADGSCTSAEDVAAEMAAAAAEATALSDAQDAAMAAFTAAMAAVYGAVDPVARDNAHMYAAMAGTANTAAQAATTSEMAMTHQMAAETASEMAVEAGMTRGLGITKLANAAANQSDIDSSALVGTPPPAPIPNAGRVSAAIKAAAGATAEESAAVSVETPAVETEETTVQMGRDPRQPASPLAVSVTAAVRHTGTAPRFTILPEIGEVSDENKAGEVLGRGELPVVLVMSGEKPGGGWEGAELVDSMSGPDGHKEYAVVYTDINPPAQTYNSDGAINLRDISGSGTLDTEDNTVVNQAVVTGEVPGDGSHFEGTYNANPSDNAPPRSGRFFCASGTPCSISVDASGVVRAIQGYVFQPAVPGSVMRGDSDYLAWGFWLNVPNTEQTLNTDGEAEDFATVAAFATGNSVFDVKVALTGTATYNGVAAGLYSAGGMVEYFDAAASLTADFGGRTGNDSDTTDTTEDSILFGAVSGSITNIKAGGMDVDGSLALGKAKLIGADHDSDPDTEMIATSFNGSTGGTLGGSAMSGTWRGRFYGKNNAPGGSVAVRTEFPTTAAGTFGATSVLPGGASLLGSFGAWKYEAVVAE